MRLKKSSLLSFALLSPIFILSGFKGFASFVDSQTYLSGYKGLIIDKVAISYPVSVVFLSFLNFFIIVRMIHFSFRFHNLSLRIIICLLLLNPYSLLLIFNLTKEQIIFATIFFPFVMRSSVTARLLNKFRYFLFAVRPIYFSLLTVFPIGIARVRYFYFFLILVLFFFLVFFTPILDFALKFLTARASIPHTGRLYFVDLCVFEKSSASDFVLCWLPVFFGFPIHSDFFSFNLFVYWALQIPTIFLFFYLLLQFELFAFSLAIFVILLSFIIFWFSPSFGASQRYFLPVLWFVLSVKFFKPFRYKRIIQCVR